MTPIPSPADLARRPAQPKPAPQPPRERAPHRHAPIQSAVPASPARPEHLLAPGSLRGKERFRATFQRGIRLSRMHPHARLLAHTLLWYSSHLTGRVSPSSQPSIEELSYGTGLTIDQVAVQLRVLESRGWLRFHTLNEGPRQGDSAMRLAIPTHVLEQIRARITGADQ
ncbi:hypothetical protein [Streptomyces fructofermentans]|uniref:Uncharacterized protein n=1 Tax=Streptomyces fructofermentans TaxID=152141 RepID=A0A918NV70_9ACTN|nr:hypothetical protein [Streptomyces fructofermentans]GGX99051.1 hypothetical protein GCM10010515_76510 [Streptomyces fructofermentans]